MIPYGTSTGAIKIVDLRIKDLKGQQKLIELVPFFPLIIIVPLCTNRIKQCIAYQWYNFTYDTKHGQQYIIKWQHEKWMLSIEIGHKKNVWTHDTYTKVLGCKTWINWPLMYTWIVKNAIDVAQTSHMTSLQVLWLIYSFHREFIYYWWLFNKK